VRGAAALLAPDGGHRRTGRGTDDADAATDDADAATDDAATDDADTATDDAHRADADDNRADGHHRTGTTAVPRLARVAPGVDGRGDRVDHRRRALVRDDDR